MRKLGKGLNQSAHFLSNGILSFSNFFWRSILNGADIKDAFNHADDSMRFLTSYRQLAELDADGNGIGNEKNDQRYARNFTLGAGIQQLADGPPRRRIGFTTERRPVREGSTLHLPDGEEVGFVSSGGFGPSADQPIGMAYVATEHADRTTFTARQRGKEVAVTVADLPFVPHRYAR